MDTISYNDTTGSIELVINRTVPFTTTQSPLACLRWYTVIQPEVWSGPQKLLFIMFVPVLLIIAITGIIGNCLSYAVLAKEMRRDGSSFCLKSLAIVDNIVLVSYALYYIPSTLYRFTGILEWYYEFFQLTMPYLWTLLWTAKAVSIYIVIFVTCSRYIAVSKPLKAHVYCTEKAAKVGLSIIIVISFIYNLPKIFCYDTTYQYENCTSRYRPVTQFSDLYRNFFFRVIYVKAVYMIVMFAFPLTILSILNFQLVRHVRKANRIRQQMSQQQRIKGTDSTTHRIIGVVFAFIILETPAIILNILYIFKDYWTGEPLNVDWKLVGYVMRISYILSIINSSINFYIYVLVGNRFRRILKRMCTCQQQRTSSMLESHYMSVHRNSESITPLRINTYNNSQRIMTDSA